MQHIRAGRLLLAFTTLLLALPTGVLAQDQDTIRLWVRPNVLKTNLLAPVSMFYERALTRRFAFRTSTRWLKLATGGVFNRQEFVKATIEGKIYTARMVNLTAKSHPTGFFVNPYVKARSMTYVERAGYGSTKVGDLDEIKVNSIGVGLTVGYQWVSRRGFVVELCHGVGGFPVTNIRHTGRYSNVVSGPNDYLKLDFRTGVSLGYAFEVPPLEAKVRAGEISIAQGKGVSMSVDQLANLLVDAA